MGPGRPRTDGGAEPVHVDGVQGVRDVRDVPVPGHPLAAPGPARHRGQRAGVQGPRGRGRQGLSVRATDGADAAGLCLTIMRARCDGTGTRDCTASTAGSSPARSACSRPPGSPLSSTRRCRISSASTPASTPHSGIALHTRIQTTRYRRTRSSCTPPSVQHPSSIQEDEPEDRLEDGPDGTGPTRANPPTWPTPRA